MDNQRFYLKDYDYDFCTSGGPIDEPSNYVDLFQAIGHANACWARMEHMIDALLLQLNKEAFSEEIYEPDHPRAFAKKIDLLKSWFNKHDKLKKNSSDMMAILPKLKEAARTRHSIVHGLIESYDTQTEELTLKGIRFIGNDEFRGTKITMNIKVIRALGGTSNAAYRLLADVALDVFVPNALTQFRTP